jgi:hypothetical protein
LPGIGWKAAVEAKLTIAPRPRRHRRRVARLEIEQGVAVEPDHRDQALAVVAVQVAGAAEPGAVDEDLDREVQPLDLGREPVALGTARSRRRSRTRRR